SPLKAPPPLAAGAACTSSTAVVTASGLPPSRLGELERPPGGSRAAVGRYFALAALGLAGPLSFMDRSTEMASPFFTSARAAGGEGAGMLPSALFSCAPPALACPPRAARSTRLSPLPLRT